MGPQFLLQRKRQVELFWRRFGRWRFLFRRGHCRLWSLFRMLLFHNLLFLRWLVIWFLFFRRFLHLFMFLRRFLFRQRSSISLSLFWFWLLLLFRAFFLRLLLSLLRLILRILLFLFRVIRVSCHLFLYFSSLTQLLFLDLFLFATTFIRWCRDRSRRLRRSRGSFVLSSLVFPLLFPLLWPLIFSQGLFQSQIWQIWQQKILIFAFSVS